MTLFDLEVSKNDTERSPLLISQVVYSGMTGWHQYPFVRILIPFISGIAVALGLEHSFHWLVQAVVLLAVLYALLVLMLMKRVDYSFRWVSGLLAFAILFSFGYLLVRLKVEKAFGDYDPADGNIHCLVRLTDDPEEKTKSYRLTGMVQAVRDTSFRQVHNMKVILYLEKVKGSMELQYGDVVVVRCNLQRLAPPLNPGEFDYAAYLALSGIYFQAYVRHGNWQKTDSLQGNSILRWSRGARRHLLRILKSHGIAGDPFALASAILLGYDGYLDPEQKQQFSGAGAMHILCVSGLHVGIIALILNSLLFFMDRRPPWSRLKLVLLVTFIWAYAAITGFSPSVLRAATMFSFVYIGSSVKKQVNIYNMLAASAFLLLVINPLFVLTIGFQLSYLAVTGILLLYKPIYSLVVSKFWLVDKCWQMSVVSIAATLFTFPLSLFYFNQFPNFFLLTNLVAIPASFLVVYIGVALLATSFVPFLADLLAGLLILLLKGLGLAVAFIESLPWAASREVYISPAEAVLLLALVACTASIVLTRAKKAVFALLFLSILFVASNAFRKWVRFNQEVLVVYAIQGHTAIGLIHGTEAVLLCDSALLLMPEKIHFRISGHFMERGIDKVDYCWTGMQSIERSWMMKQGPLLFFGGRVLRLLEAGDRAGWLPFLSGEDCMVVSDASGGKPEEILAAVETGMVVLDASLPAWKRRKWDEACRVVGVHFHDVRTGAFLHSPQRNEME